MSIKEEKIELWSYILDPVERVDCMKGTANHVFIAIYLLLHNICLICHTFLQRVYQSIHNYEIEINSLEVSISHPFNA
jgi:hypothetical protein